MAASSLHHRLFTRLTEQQPAHRPRREPRHLAAGPRAATAHRALATDGTRHTALLLEPHAPRHGGGQRTTPHPKPYSLVFGSARTAMALPQGGLQGEFPHAHLHRELLLPPGVCHPQTRTHAPTLGRAHHAGRSQPQVVATGGPYGRWLLQPRGRPHRVGALQPVCVAHGQHGRCAHRRTRRHAAEHMATCATPHLAAGCQLHPSAQHRPHVGQTLHLAQTTGLHPGAQRGGLAHLAESVGGCGGQCVVRFTTLV